MARDRIDPTTIKCRDCVNYAYAVNMMLMGDTTNKVCVDCCMSNPVGKNYEAKEKK